jgi:hypothetical protein
MAQQASEDWSEACFWLVEVDSTYGLEWHLDPF